MGFLLKRFVKTATEPEKEGHDEELRLRRSQLTPQKRSRTLRWNGYCTLHSVKFFRLSHSWPRASSVSLCPVLMETSGHLHFKGRKVISLARHVDLNGASSCLKSQRKLHSDRCPSLLDPVELWVITSWDGRMRMQSVRIDFTVTSLWCHTV